MIKCPCNKCCLGKWLDVESAHGDILRHSFLPGYTEWTVHGEHTISLPPSHSTNVNVEETFFGQEDIRGLVHDALGINSLPSNNTQLGDTTIEGDTEDSTENGDHGDEGVSYKRLLEECDKELYVGCKYSNLSFILHLYHIKCIGGISNKTFSMILELLRDAFPYLTPLPSSAYEVKKFTKDLGLGYEKIHACPNDYMLYWDNRAGQQSCHICKASRYKSDEVGGSSKSHKPNKPAKVLRYFPLIPRLKRLYKCEKTAKDMRWHDTGRTKDRKLRHPTDGLAWSAFNDRYSQFASDPRSVRLGLASDGFNPFVILSSIIPGEKAPSNDIDVYIKPLIKELQLLWKGVDAYDAFSKQHFKLKASLMWTINDFPAYANLSGWSTKGRVACPVCANSTRSRWLKHGKKNCYMGHRRWLETTSHNFQTQSKSFPMDMQTTRQAINNTNHPSSALKATFGPSFSYNIPQNSSAALSSHMQTTRQAINNTNHLSSSFQSAIRPSFPYNIPQNSSAALSSHMQTTRQAINNTNHLSSSFQPAIRPSFLYDMRQNSSSSSSLEASVGPNVHHNSSSSSSSSRSQSLQSQPTVHEPALHQSSSSNSLLNHDQDLLSEVEINLADQYEQNLLSEVEIIDGNGNILRTQKMTAKQVYKLNGGEKVLVHVNKDYQLIKNSGGLCSRFITLILKEPNCDTL
ncbi:tetratricopeptide-like helical domain, DYW domain protein [Tanacetum coccineum]